MDPLSAGMFASIGSAFKFADVAVRIAEVGSENAVFVRTIYVVRSDLEEVERLLSLESVRKKLDATPRKLPWIKNALHNTRCALNEIGKWVERARVEQESTGSIKFDTRVRWVFSDHEKLVNRKTELLTCHQQLSNILGYLIGLEVAPSRPVPEEYGDGTHFDDILARHRRTSRPQAPSKDIERKPKAAKQGILQQPVSVGPVSSEPTLLPLGFEQAISLRVQTSKPYDRDSSLRSPSLASTLSPPGSPPPTYATAVSIDPFTFDVRSSPRSPNVTDRSAVPSPSTDRKSTLQSLHSGTWAYRSNFEGVAIPELAGDTVVLSATNSAGPVNPFELCADPGIMPSHHINGPWRPRDNISEMLGDLHFPAELRSHELGPPLGYPPRSLVTSDQVGILRTSHLALRNRMISETRPAIQRRPVPTNAFSDSLLTIHELPKSMAPHNPPLPVSDAVFQSIARTLTPGTSSGDPLQSEISQRPSSYTAHQSQWHAKAPMPAHNRHYSAPPPIPVTRSDYAAAFSAESTSSWGLDTQPKVLHLPRAQEPVKATRMQSQKRMMDLLGSIGN